MLSAKTQEQQFVQLTQLQPRQIEKLKHQRYYCPLCNEPVYLKNGKIKRAHFAHQKQSLCQRNHQGETEEHRTLKYLFARWCEQDHIACSLEHYLPAIDQIPDILIGNRVLEIQCSPLPVTRLVERTHTYDKAGYRPIWICGAKLGPQGHPLTYLKKNLCSYSKEKGFYLWQANVEKKELYLYYHLEENHLGQLYYSKKCFPFYQSHLLKTLNLPHMKEHHTQRVHQIGQLVKVYYQELTRKLRHKNEQIRRVQSVLYLEGLHVLELPIWFYYPGIRLFCCRQSDLLIKIEIWKWLQLFDQKILSTQELQQGFYSLFLKGRLFFYEFPIISPKNLFFYYFQQMTTTLIQCRHLKSLSKSTWFVHVPKQQMRADFQQSIARLEKKSLISAIPMESVIR